DRDHFGRRKAAEHRDDLPGQVLNRKKTGEGDDGQQGRKEGKEEVIGLLGREVEQVVGPYFLPRSDSEVFPAQRNLQMSQHALNPSNRAATGGCRGGAERYDRLMAQQRTAETEWDVIVV